MKILVLCDDSSDPRPLIIYGIAKARASQGELVYLYFSHRQPDRECIAQPGLSEKALQKTLHSLEKTREWVRREGCGIRTSAAFTIIKDQEDILRYVRDTGVDIIVATSSHEPLLDKACCHVDIVAIEEETVAAR
jgi:hypothetical protein